MGLEAVVPFFVLVSITGINKPYSRLETDKSDVKNEISQGPVKKISDNFRIVELTIKSLKWYK